MRVFSFFILVLCFCKYTEKNFMGFEYASIKLLFPYSKCHLLFFCLKGFVYMRMNTAIFMNKDSL